MVIIGAGPAGLAAAIHALDAGLTVELFEAGEQVGGLARTIELWNQPVDIGSHIFSGGSAAALRMWDRFLGDAPHTVSLRRGIMRHGTLLEHPPDPGDLASRLPLATTLRCGMSAIRARATSLLSRPIETSSEEWVVARYGQELYDILLRDYIEKLWGCSGREIDAAFATALFTEARRHGGASIGPRVATAGSSFLFPRGGTGAVWKRMEAYIRTRATVHLGARVERVLIDRGHVVGVRAHGNDHVADAVVSSMPLHLLTRAVDAPREILAFSSLLETRHVVIAHLLVEGGPALDRAWVYIHDRNLAVGRLADSRTWHGSAGDDRGIVTMEFWCGSGDFVWLADDPSVVVLATRELQATGLYDIARVIDGHVTRLPSALPIPTCVASRRLNRVEAYLAGIGGLFSVGRHGQFAYNSMAASIDSGIRAATAAIADRPR
jgi:protoporphyrinogen oxidase